MWERRDYRTVQASKNFGQEVLERVPFEDVNINCHRRDMSLRREHGHSDPQKGSSTKMEMRFMMKSGEN